MPNHESNKYSIEHKVDVSGFDESSYIIAAAFVIKPPVTALHGILSAVNSHHQLYNGDLYHYATNHIGTYLTYREEVDEKSTPIDRGDAAATKAEIVVAGLSRRLEAIGASDLDVVLSNALMFGREFK